MEKIMRKFNVIITIAVLSLSPISAMAAVIFFINDEAGWTAAAGGAANVEVFETTASNIALANEIGSAPVNNTNLGTAVLTFDTANTLVSPSFTMHSNDAPSFHYFDTFPVVNEGIQFNPFNNDANDWDVTFSGAPLRAFSIDLISSDKTAGESFSVFGASGLLGSTTAIPDGNADVIFLGVVSTELITSVVYDENGIDGDNTGIADLQFSQTSIVPIPAAAWLFGSALLGLGAVKRR